MTRSLLALSALALAAPLAAPQSLPGDILVNTWLPSGIAQFRPDGTLVQVTQPGTGSLYSGATITASGLWMTARREPTNGFNLFDPVTGAEVATYEAPEITTFIGDTAVLSDGTLAILDGVSEVELYTETGTHQGTLTTPGSTYLFGLHVNGNDEFWICDVGTPDSGGGRIWHLDRFGTVLGVFTTSFEPGDLVEDSDGSLYVTNRLTRQVLHLSASGAVLDSFTVVGVEDDFHGIAQASDGTLFLSSVFADAIYRYDRQGHLLSEIPTVPSFHANFMTVVPGNPAGTALCFGDGNGAPCGCANEIPGGDGGCRNGLGLGARLDAVGQPDTTEDSLVLTASNVPAQPGLFFQGDNEIAGGAGQTFGDGVRCCGQGVIRLQIVSPPAPEPTTATTSIEISSHPAQSGLPGSTRCFQYWYRNPGSSPCGSNFNLSNAIRMPWI